MHVYLADPQFRPVTIVLETQDDLDKLLAVVANVANNRINHAPQIIEAAKVIEYHLHRAGQQQE